MATNNSVNNTITNNNFTVPLGTVTAGTGLIATTGGVTATGASTLNGGVVNIGSDATTNAINIGTGAAARPVIVGGGSSTGATTIGNTTGTTTINFGGGSALTTYVDWTAFTPTLFGVTTTGVTTYTTQVGFYRRIGNSILIQFFIVTTGQTGTGLATVGNFPFTISSATDYTALGSISLIGFTWPASTTQVDLLGVAGNVRAVMISTGSAVAAGFVALPAGAVTIRGSLEYRI